MDCSIKNPSTESVGPDLTRLKSFPAGGIDGERIVNADLEPEVGFLTPEPTMSRDIVRSLK